LTARTDTICPLASPIYPRVQIQMIYPDTFMEILNEAISETL